MLEEYKVGQPNIYNLFINAMNYNRLSHAYLVDSNNNSNTLNIILSISKMLICPNNYTAYEKCKDCKICKRIDNNNYLEIKIIKPEGNFIKKEQIIELQNDFSKLSIEGNKKIYIVLESEKMNDSTSNSILKFLEEPRDNIIAFLITNNINGILPTIRSRCQMIKLQKEKTNYETTLKKISNIICVSTEQFNEMISSKKFKEILEEAINFIKYYEDNNYSTIIYNEKTLNVKNKNKEDLIILFDILINFYYDVLLNLTINKIKIFGDYLDIINFVCKKNNIDRILCKIEVFLKYKEMMRYNLNVSLLFDDMIIKLEGE